MSLNPITREEKFLAKAGGEDVGELKPITRKEQFLAKIAGGGSGGSGGSGGGSIAWADIKDKPFGETVEDITISFDCGNTEGLEFVEMIPGYGLYKISDLVPTKENLLGAAFISNMGNSDILAEDIEIRGDGNIQIFGSIFIVLDYNAISMPISSNGVWFNYSPSMQGMVFDLKYTARTIKTLDPKFLPAGGGGGVLYVEVNLDEGTVLTPWETIENALNKNQDIIVKTSGRVYRLSNYDNGLIVLSCTIESILYNLFVKSNGECYSMDFQLQAELMM